MSVVLFRHLRFGILLMGLLLCFVQVAAGQSGTDNVADDPPVEDVLEESSPSEGEEGNELAPLPSTDDFSFANPPMWDEVCLPSKYWFEGDYLHWWTKGNSIPVLVTTSPLGTARADAGVLGMSTTSTLFGGDAIDDEDRPGVRLNFGVWTDDAQTTGLGASYFSIFDDAGTGDFSSATIGPFGSGNPILARPFLNAQSMAEDSELVSYPGILDGSITVSSSSELHSAAGTVRRLYREGSCGRVDILAGYRYLRYREGISVFEQLVSTDPGGVIAQGTEFDVYDSFVTENDFHGGEIGFSAQFWRPDWTLELLAKLAVGNLHRQSRINGSTVTRTPPPGSTTTSATGGLLALPTNIGSRTSDTFAAVGELGVNFNMALTECVSIRCGYTVVVMTDVYRTGGMIDRSVNPTYIPGGTAPSGTPRPMRLDNDSEFWAQGVNFGVVWEG